MGFGLIRTETLENKEKTLVHETVLGRLRSEFRHNPRNNIPLVLIGNTIRSRMYGQTLG